MATWAWVVETGGDRGGDGAILLRSQEGGSGKRGSTESGRRIREEGIHGVRKKDPGRGDPRRQERGSSSESAKWLCVWLIRRLRIEVGARTGKRSSSIFAYSLRNVGRAAVRIHTIKCSSSAQKPDPGKHNPASGSCASGSTARWAGKRLTNSTTHADAARIESPWTEGIQSMHPQYAFKVCIHRCIPVCIHNMHSQCA